jgi:hypothetical protein
MQTPHEVVMQNGKLSDGSQWRTLGVPPPHCKSITRATWQHSYGNKIECLAQGMPGCNTGTNSIVFIKKNQLPQNRAKEVTYQLNTCFIRPEKIEEPNQTRLVAGGDRVHYVGNAEKPTADLLTVKLLINSTISTPNAKYMTMDIKDFYLNTPMVRYEYM